jgi:hypothetical protein
MIWVEKKKMRPAKMIVSESMERDAAMISFIPHDSNFLATGKRMKEISNAIPSGIMMVLAKMRKANNAKIIAMA